ncbi:MAG: hypothetical protein M3O80_01290 [Chloroflexota bacterium]|nr:hypothetical protein [Chloroflexota bacterium]
MTDPLVKPPGHTQFRVVSFVDEFLGWAAGITPDEKAFLVQTKDGGRTWSALPAPSAYVTAGDELRFVDAQHGWLRTNVMIASTGGCVVPSTAPPACRSVILHTSDGGHTWQEQLSLDQPSKLGPGLRALTVLDDLHAWAVQLGHSSGSSTDASSSCTPFDCAIGVVATSDGSTWAPVGDLPAFVDGMDFVTALTGFASVHTAKNETGSPTNAASIMVTHDGGRTWTTQLRVEGKGPRFFVDFIDPQIGFALEKEVATCGGPECWLYGLYRTSDAGQSWNKVLPIPVDISGAWWSPRGPIATLGTPAFSSATVGWIRITRDLTQQSFDGGVLVTSDGGRSWKRMPAAPEGWDVSGLAARRSSAWIVGQRASEDSFVAHTGDRGQTWDYPLLAQP